MPICPSNHREEVLIATQRDIKDSLRTQGISAKLSEAPKAPKISRISPPGQREDYKKYSADASAAIIATLLKACDGGGLSATKVNMR